MPAIKGPETIRKPNLEGRRNPTRSIGPAHAALSEAFRHG
jgi:hypothetical protein